jgi:hypothetical protein
LRKYCALRGEKDNKDKHSNRDKGQQCRIKSGRVLSANQKEPRQKIAYHYQYRKCQSIVGSLSQVMLGKYYL